MILMLPIQSLLKTNFGNLDHENRMTGAHGFERCCDDLVIKHSRNLVDEEHGWRTKANRKLAQDLQIKQELTKIKKH